MWADTSFVFLSVCLSVCLSTVGHETPVHRSRRPNTEKCSREMVGMIGCGGRQVLCIGWRSRYRIMGTFCTYDKGIGGGTGEEKGGHRLRHERKGSWRAMVIWNFRVGDCFQRKRNGSRNQTQCATKTCILRCRTKLSRMFLRCKKSE